MPEPKEADMVEPELDMGMVNTLIQNGVPELAAKHAVFNSGGASADEAIMWFYGNIENPVLQTPLLVPNTKKADTGNGGFVPDASGLEMLTAMGFDAKEATRALRKCDNNVERAAEFVMSHMGEPDSADEAPAESMQVDSQNTAANDFENKDESNGVYKMQSTITHLGAGLHSGHYVCHIKAPDSQKWLYFNDDKVAEMDDPPLGKGYMYFLRKQ